MEPVGFRFPPVLSLFHFEVCEESASLRTNTLNYHALSRFVPKLFPSCANASSRVTTARRNGTPLIGTSAERYDWPKIGANLWKRRSAFQNRARRNDDVTIFSVYFGKQFLNRIALNKFVSISSFLSLSLSRLFSIIARNERDKIKLWIENSQPSITFF